MSDLHKILFFRFIVMASGEATELYILSEYMMFKGPFTPEKITVILHYSSSNGNIYKNK